MCALQSLVASGSAVAAVLAAAAVVEVREQPVAGSRQDALSMPLKRAKVHPTQQVVGPIVHHHVVRPTRHLSLNPARQVADRAVSRCSVRRRWLLVVGGE